MALLLALSIGSVPPEMRDARTSEPLGVAGLVLSVATFLSLNVTGLIGLSHNRHRLLTNILINTMVAVCASILLYVSLYYAAELQVYRRLRNGAPESKGGGGRDSDSRRDGEDERVEDSSIDERALQRDSVEDRCTDRVTPSGSEEAVLGLPRRHAVALATDTPRHMGPFQDRGVGGALLPQRQRHAHPRRSRTRRTGTRRSVSWLEPRSSQDLRGSVLALA